jgi:hypothetical protein
LPSGMPGIERTGDSSVSCRFLLDRVQSPRRSSSNRCAGPDTAWSRTEPEDHSGEESRQHATRNIRPAVKSRARDNRPMMKRRHRSHGIGNARVDAETGRCDLRRNDLAAEREQGGVVPPQIRR